MSSSPARLRYVAAFVLLVVAAAYFVLIELHTAGQTAALDVYIYYLPNKLHAVYSARDGGKGLLWNPYQSCGEPFFANPAMGLLYPPHLLFLFLEPNTAVHVVLILNMVIGGSGMLLLLRELGLGWPAALAGALLFQLGDPMAQLNGWSPMQNGPWAWVPWALLMCERLLRAPTRRRVGALAVILALALMPGWVLITALTYQLIALRVGWELMRRAAARPWRGALAVGAALLLAPCLAAVQLLPAAEFAEQSSRVAFEAKEFAKFQPAIGDLLKTLAQRIPPLPFVAAPLLLAAVAVCASTSRWLAAFYLLVGCLYAVLALGPATPLFRLYVHLPPGAATLRYSIRLFWICGLSLVLLAALGLDAVRRPAERPARRWTAFAVAAGVALALFAWTPGNLRWSELVAIALVLAALLTAAVRPALGGVAVWVAAAAVTWNVVAVPLHYGGRLLDSIDSYWRHAPTLLQLDPPLSAQDRLFIMPTIASMFDLSLIRKTGSILRLPDIFDYDALVELRHAQFVVMMWHGAPINGTEDFTSTTVRGGFRRRLLDLTAARVVAASPKADMSTLELPPLAGGDGGLRLFRNDSALPRARYVPRLKVIPDPSVLLNRLAYGDDDLATVAFVEETPSSGFTGEPRAPSTPAAVQFVQNDPEHLVIDVDAPQRGFLVLADEYYAGWRATVNGVRTPILRANYAFRVVEVPAGQSRVEFRYRPGSVAIGGALSLGTLGALTVILWSNGRERRLSSAGV